MNKSITVNAANKLNFLTNNNLMNEWKKLRTELKVQLLVKNERFLNEPFSTTNPNVPILKYTSDTIYIEYNIHLLQYTFDIIYI